MLGRSLDRLPKRFRMSLHNLVGHPLSEYVYLLTGREDWSNKIHDATLPASARGEHGGGEKSRPLHGPW